MKRYFLVWFFALAAGTAAWVALFSPQRGNPLLTGYSKPKPATSYSLTPEYIKQVMSGDSDSLSHPEPVQFFEACQLDDFCLKLKELHLNYDLSKYNSPDVARLVKLEKITLFATSNTDKFIDAIPQNIETLIVVQTDLSPDGISKIGRFANLESLHFSPWRKSETDAMLKIIRKLDKLKHVGVEWIDGDVVKLLRAEFPSVEIEEHPPGG